MSARYSEWNIPTGGELVAELSKYRRRDRTAKLRRWGLRFGVSALAGFGAVGLYIAADAWTSSKPVPRVWSMNSESSSSPSAVSFRSCAAARAAGRAPIRRGEPGYAPHLDADNDGIACEPYRWRFW
jgi:hypothetical protein